MNDVNPASGHPYTTLPAGMTPCARCSTAIEAATADYGPDGSMVCTRCAAANDLAATESRAVSAMKALGYGNLGMGLLAWFFNPIFLISALVLANAVIVTRAVSDEWYVRRMGANRFGVSAAAILGGVIGGLPLIVFVLGLATMR